MATAPLTASAPAFSYDEVPYDSHPFLQTHPSRLFTVATLFGLRPTPVQTLPRPGTRLRRGAETCCRWPTCSPTRSFSASIYPKSRSTMAMR